MIVKEVFTLRVNLKISRDVARLLYALTYLS